MQKEPFSPIDHPIFKKSIQLIRRELGDTSLEPLEQQVLERLIHSSGDFTIKNFLKFSPGACVSGLAALRSGSLILTDTSMAACAVLPMSRRTLNLPVKCILDWAPKSSPIGSTRTAVGMQRAWQDITKNYLSHQSPVVLIGSSPTALNTLLNLTENGFPPPALIIGMPVGFVGVQESKTLLSNSNYPQIRIEGTRGGAALAAAAVNALLRAAV